MSPREMESKSRSKTSNAEKINEVVSISPTPRTRFLDKNSVFIYLSHFLSSFGDRIWFFAVGLYLYYLYPCSLLLTAVYGLSTCASLFLLGAPVGRWVDKSKRLKAARIAILVQNVSVVLNAAIMTSAIHFKAEMRSMWKGQVEFVLYAVIILLEVTAELASMANKLVLEKDWIVVLAGGDEQKLSNLNATMRTINLSCKIIAPFFVGHLLEYFNYLAGAIFIAVWNVVSAVAEYYLLYLIFSQVPELSRKSGQIEGAAASSTGEKAVGSGDKVEQLHLDQITPGANPNDSDTKNDNEQGDAQGLTSEPSPPEILEEDGAVAVAVSEKDQTDLPHEEAPPQRCSFLQSFSGWSIYFHHPVKFAGLALASLYMTVLSFDSVTVAYLASQGVSAAMTGNLSAASALIGILGSLSFPFFRKRLGKNKAGLLGFGLETCCLLFCVGSIFAPGSSFKPESLHRIVEVGSVSCRNKTGAGMTLSIREQWDQHSNIFLLMIGISTARYGLWIADLSVTQIFQEKVEESQRGAMGGVQGSLNQLISLFKFALTIVLPYPETFGYLICLSWLFVFFGWLLFSLFVCRDRKRNKTGPMPLTNSEIRHNT